MNAGNINNDPLEKELISKLKLGSKAAFEKLFNIYHERLYFFCYSLTNNVEEAENITQESFFKIWINRNKINEEKSFSGFLYTIAKNLIINQLKKEINKQKFINFILDYPKETSNQTERDIYYDDLNDTLNNLIAILPPKRKEIFILSKRKGFSIAEISSYLGISTHTVESQLVKALKFIRNGLSDFAPFLFLFVYFLGKL